MLSYPVDVRDAPLIREWKQEVNTVHLLRFPRF